MFELSQEAARDVDEILDYTLRTYGLTQAETYLASLQEAFKRLARNPTLWRERTEFDPPVRIYHHTFVTSSFSWSRKAAGYTTSCVFCMTTWVLNSIWVG